ncbi:Vacuolar protein sorting-associated protein 41 [Rhizina undulata]
MPPKTAKDHDEREEAMSEQSENESAHNENQDGQEHGDQHHIGATGSEHAIEEDEEDAEEEEEEEPRLKYSRLTRSLAGVYRNGDAVSASLVFGERMILGTHNGNIHILTLPSLNTLRVYHAHSASVTSISISPPPPPPLPHSLRRQRDPNQDRNIHVATSSIDGLVCIVPLLPSSPSSHPGVNAVTNPYAKSEVILKNFKRPILAVALSPNFQTDRTFISGGLAGNLVLSTVSTPGSAGSWIGLGGGGRDTILHSGEGAISAIAWSKESPRFVAWTNEHGIKVMRSHIIPPSLKKNGTSEIAEVNPGVTSWIPGLGVGAGLGGEVAWKRISAIERPGNIPEELAAVYKPRLQWIDRRALSPEDDDDNSSTIGGSSTEKKVVGVEWGDKEKLVVGWGPTIWVVDVFAGDGNGGENSAGWAEIAHVLQTDCIIAGLTIYAPTLLLVLAYRTSDLPEAPSPPAEEFSSQGDKGKGPAAQTRRGRTNALTPELRFIDLDSSEELSADELMMSRFEGLSVGDYHLGILPANPPMTTRPPSAGSESEIGIAGSIWGVAAIAPQVLSGAASIRSFGGISRRESFTSSFTRSGTFFRNNVRGQQKEEVGWPEDVTGMKIYITSPYDVVFATERSKKDHLGWLLEKEKYAEAWELVDRNPSVIVADAAALSEYDEIERRVIEDDDGYESDSTTGQQRSVRRYSASEKEKRRIGELWLQKLIKGNEWAFAGAVCGKVLGTSSRWDYWVWVFEAAGKIQEITPYIPTTQLSPPLPSVIYEIVLAHYLKEDRQRFKELLLETWKPERSRPLYDARTIIDAVERKLNNREEKIRTGDQDWNILQECLARLFMIVGEPRNALKYFIVLKNADEAFKLIREFRLVDSVRDDIPAIIFLRLSDHQLDNASVKELEKETEEAIGLLVDEAGRGIVDPGQVVEQLENDDVPSGRLFLFFYLRRLWERDGGDTKGIGTGMGAGGILAEYGDLMVELFAEYDRELLMEFLRESHSYSLELASEVCERRNYIPELVHLLSKTGQTKRALFLIIDKLADVSQAISFAKSQDDPDLWNDLLDYSMDKPKFIRGLLENIGTAIDPITLIKRIPLGLEIDGLKKALGKILKEYGVQWSISEGVAKVLRSEVARGMDDLRGGRRRGVKFIIGGEEEEEGKEGEKKEGEEAAKLIRRRRGVRSDQCGLCLKPFVGGQDKQTLIAFACKHVFHLPCLIGEDEAEEALPQSVTGYGSLEDEIMGSGRTVGGKVTHAALIREKVAKGCTLCKKKEADAM